MPLATLFPPEPVSRFRHSMCGLSQILMPSAALGEGGMREEVAEAPDIGKGPTVIVVSVVRMYVAAHLLLDLISGAALGVFVASAVSLVLRVPRRATAEDP